MKKILFLIVALVSITALAACGTSNNGSKNGETRTIKHQLGTTKIPKNPKKVVVFDFGTLDTMDKLGLSSIVAGVPKQNIPDYLKAYNKNTYKNVGGLKQPDFEAIDALHPDLIIISKRQEDSYKKFSSIAPTIFVGVDNKNYYQSFKSNVKQLGEIFNKEKEVKANLSDIDHQVNDVKQKTDTSKDKALIVMSTGGKVTAFGPNSKYGFIYDVFGVAPSATTLSATATHGQNISMEFIMNKNPDILFVIDRDAAIGQGANAKNVIENALVKKTNAYKHSKIIYLNPSLWYLSGGGLESFENMAKDVESVIK